MAEAIGFISATFALAEIAAKSALSLKRLIESFHNHNKTACELQEELASLIGLLRELDEAVIGSRLDSAALKLPLRQCSQLCHDYEDLITKCTVHFDGRTTSLRDWAQLKVKEDDIISLKTQISSYKSTITVALGCINLRMVHMTSEDLHKLQRVITSTTSELENRLERIDDGLQTLSSYGAFISEEDKAKRDRLQVEKDTIKQCLAICAQGTTETELLLQSVLKAENKSSNEIAGEIPLGWCMLAAMLKENQGRLCNAKSSFETRLQDVEEELEAIRSANNRKLLERSQLEKEALQQCVRICAQASEEASKKQRNVFEDVTTAPEAFQAIVVVPEHSVSAKRVNAGFQSTQLLGTLLDSTVLQLSKDHTEIHRCSSAKEAIHEPVKETTRDVDDPQTQPIGSTAQQHQPDGQSLKKTPRSRRQQISWASLSRSLARISERKISNAESLFNFKSNRQG